MNTEPMYHLEVSTTEWTSIPGTDKKVRLSPERTRLEVRESPAYLPDFFRVVADACERQGDRMEGDGGDYVDGEIALALRNLARDIRSQA